MTRKEHKLRYERRADEAERLSTSLSRTEQQDAELHQPTTEEIEGGMQRSGFVFFKRVLQEEGRLLMIVKENERNREAEGRITSLHADVPAAMTADRGEGGGGEGSKAKAGGRGCKSFLK